MSRLRIGVCLKAFGVPLRRALADAQKIGAAGVEIDATGALAPQALSQTGRRELRHLLHSHDLELTAVACPLRRGLDSDENQQQRIDFVRDAMALSFDLGPRLAVVHPGKIVDDDKDPRAAILRESLMALGSHGDRVGARLALETGLENGAALARYLGRFDTGSLAACLNPGNLLVNGHDPSVSARALGGHVIHVHATDARQDGAGKGARTVPLGHGDIDWLLLLATLEEIGYHGWLVIDREPSPGAAAELAAAVKFLRRLTGWGAPA